MKQHAEKICIWAIIFQVVSALICFGMSGWNKSGAVYATGWLFVLGIVFWFLTYVDLRANRVAEEEDREEKEFERRRGAQDTKKLFEDRKAEDALTARIRLRRLEKWFFPIISLLHGITSVVFSYLLLYGRIGYFEFGQLTKQLPSIAFMGGITFLSFIFSRYVAGLSEEKKSQGLKTCAGAMFSGTIATFLIAIAFVLSSFDYLVIERVMVYVVSLIIGLTGVELVFNFVTHFYRPRVHGRLATPVYYSRMLSLIAMPTSIFRATAETLDYQFGFRISETWFYQFIERAAAPLIFYLLLSLYLFSSVVIVQSDEEVIVERFGTPLKSVLGPGLHIKLPWPIDKSYRYKKSEIKELTIGVIEKELPDNVLAWIRPHNESEFPFIVAQKERIEKIATSGDDEDIDPAVAFNLITLNVKVQYEIDNSFKYAYNKAEPEQLFEDLAKREFVRYCATVDYNRFMGEGRREAEIATKKRIDAVLASEQLGIKLLSVNISDIHPPIETVKEFEAVMGALEEKEAKIWEAKGYANGILNEVAGTSRKALIKAVREYDKAITEKEKALTEGNADALRTAEEAVKTAEADVARYLINAGGSVSRELQKSDSERYRLKALTQADSESFRMKAAAFGISPEIYKLRFRLQTIAASMAEARWYIVPANSKNTEVMILNLEERGPSLIDTYKAGTDK